MAVDLKRTWALFIESTPLATGATLTEEGQGLVSILDGGIEKVMPSAGASGEIFAGFAVFRQLSYSTAPNVELLTVPASAPYTVDLAANNLITGQLRVLDVLAGTNLAVVTIAPTTGQVQINYTSGLLTFNSAQAGRQMKAYYRFNLTVAQAKALYYEAATNYPDANLFGQVGVSKSKGRLYTTYYDQSIQWDAPLAGPITLAAGGMLTVGGSGPAVPGARVVYAPDVGVAISSSAQLLGIEYNA